ncbi:hypothetical protein E3N88_07297 [Mikania micrantha]|uniref:Endonuclease/exonuclease/phosphatase domain-containing protein n=1 Tax=Mikania micrantha TaxID=192012 RepID=A0A5N6PRV2_9ASTR|nr:hypothetical protein E3N88_07297 [Mikania micrantha]
MGGRGKEEKSTTGTSCGEEVVAVVSAYAPHVGIWENEKTEFWDCMDEIFHRYMEISIFWSRNDSGASLLHFAMAHDLGIVNSFFKKKDSHLITFSSGGRDTQIDYLLIRRRERSTWLDCKVFSKETTASQHKLLVTDIVMRKKLTDKRNVRPWIRWGSLKGDNLQVFRYKVFAGRDSAQYEDANAMWEAMANNVKRVARETLGMTTRSLGGQRESCWWNDEVQHKFRTKKERFRELVTCTEDAQKESLRTKYKEAKREARKAVYEAKNKAYKQMYKHLETKEGEHDIFKIAKARERRRQDIGVLRFIKGEDG